ncbi:hypothetical protein Dimus_032461 [Dionaea muscipula]
MFYSSTPDLPHQRSRLPATGPTPLVPPSEMEWSLANVTGDTSRKRKRQNADLFFHEEVLVEILARLPVRSLLRFKCVCKTWFSLIGSEYFTVKHLSARSKMFKDYTFENLLVDYHHNHPDRYGMRCLQFSAADIDTLSVVRRHKFKIVSSSPDSVNRPHPTCWFVGSCNGIVCLLVKHFFEERRLTQQSLLLWNPATGEVKDLQHEKVIDHVLGFGFDPKKNDYKVVLIGYPWRPKLTEHVFVYSSRSDSWKSLDMPHWPEFEFSHFLLTSTTSSGGRMLNWLGFRRHTHHYIIISFDLSEESFVMTPMPPGTETECKCGRKLQKCRLIQNTPDEPCTLVCFPNWNPTTILDDERKCFDNQNSIHIWTLNEYGESGSWTKLPSLMMWKGGEEVLFKLIKQFDHDDALIPSYNPIWLGYTESLVSINGRYGGGGLLQLDDPNTSVHDVKEDKDDFRQKPDYYSLVDGCTGRIISRFDMATTLYW